MRSVPSTGPYTNVAPCSCWKMCKVVTFNCFLVWTMRIRKSSRSLLFSQLHWLIIHCLLQNSSVLVTTTWQYWYCWHHRYSNSFLHHRGQHGGYTATKDNKRVSSRLHRDSVYNICRLVSQKEIWICSVKDHTVPVFQQATQRENRTSNIQNRESYFQTGWTPSKTQIHTTTAKMLQRFS